MLTFLSKLNKDLFEKVAKKRKVSINVPILSTPQTIALLARIGGLNDKRMKLMKSYLRKVAKVNIQMSKEEVKRIDFQVGLNRTREVWFLHS